MEKISSLSLDNKNNNENKLIIRTLGTTEGVNKAFTTYEYADELFIVDCGIGYPDMVDMPGVDVLIPDFTYVLENSHRVKGLFITHAHADHIAAVPYLLQELPDIHIYGSQFVIEMIKSSLTDRNFKHLAEGTHFHLLDPKTTPVSLKHFKISAFGINHSVPETQGYAIDTPEGKVLHIADYKFDESPVLDKPFDIETVKKHAEEGVLALLSDCLSIDKPGTPRSEKTLDHTFYDLLEKAGNRQVFVTVLSSNVSRMFQITKAAVKYGRKIVASGRSVENVIKIARKLGYLPFQDADFVTEKEASSYDQGALLYIIAGCYGQPESSLGRLSRNEHNDITLEKDAIVVFSGEPGPPEINVPVEKMTDTLILNGVEVVDGDTMADLHVSGHGGQVDMEKLAKLVHPKYFVPIGGTITKMRKYKNFIKSLGFNDKNVFECLEGDSIEFSNGVGKKGEHINLAPIYISTGRGDELPAQIIKDRDVLSDDGVFVVVVAQDKKSGKINADLVEVITRGFIYVKDSKELMAESKKFITKALNSRMVKSKDWNELKRSVERDIDKFLYKKIGRTPLIILHALSV